MWTSLRAISAIVLMAFLSMFGRNVSADFHVAPAGDDSQSGAEEAPFASLERAQRAVREVVGQGLQTNLNVVIRAGTYRLSVPLHFGPEDSGTAEHRITYAPYPGETVILSGGVPITGWTAQGDNRWTATLPDAEPWTFRQLFVDGARLTRGRFPNAPELLRVKRVSDDLSEIVLDRPVPVEDLAGSDAELVMFQNWSISRAGIVSSHNDTVRLMNPMGWVGHGDATSASAGKPTYLEHALAFVDAPGEWYLDSDTRVLTYQAAEGEDPNTRSFIAPKSEQWIVVEGRPEAPVRNLHFKGLQFSYTSWSRPPFGYNGIQAGHYGTSMKEPTYVLPVGIEISYARDCSFTDCRIAHTGAGGIGFGAGARRNSVSGCELSDIGGNGVMVGWRGKGRLTSSGQGDDSNLSGDWIDHDDAPVGNVIVGNIVRQCGSIHHGCVGIFDAFAQGTRIAHNLVHDTPYTGISVGFRWNESETSQRDTLIEYNHVYDTMKMLADGGCLYTLGYQPGTIIRGNVFHDVRRSEFAHGGAPNNGIFFDQGSKGYRVIGNTVYNTSGNAIRFNQTSKENMSWENNRFGVGPTRGNTR